MPNAPTVAVLFDFGEEWMLVADWKKLPVFNPVPFFMVQADDTQYTSIQS